MCLVGSPLSVIPSRRRRSAIASDSRTTRRRWLLALAIVALLIVVTELVVRLVPVDAYRGVIESRLGLALGLDVELAGDVHLSLLPSLHVAVQDVRVANLPGRPSPFLARVGEFEVSLNLWPFVRHRELEIRSLYASDVALHIEPDRKDASSFHRVWSVKQPSMAR